MEGLQLKIRYFDVNLFFTQSFFDLEYLKPNLVIFLYRNDIFTIPERLKAVTQTEAELQRFACRKMTTRIFTGPRFRCKIKF